MPKVNVLRESCKGVENCGICMFVCPKALYTNSDEMNAAGYIPPEITDENECHACRNCMLCCPDFAIVVEKDDAASASAPEEEDG